MAVNSVDIKLLNGSKQEVSYTGVETITIPKAVGSGVETFTAGIPLDSSAVQITPDFTSGNMVVDAPSGYVVRDAVLLKPSGMESVIGKGETLMGVAGEYVTPGTTKSVSLDFSSGDMSIAASGDERWSQIDIFKPATLIPGNILEGVEIAGVAGGLIAVTAGSFINKTLSVLSDDTIPTVPAGFLSGFSLLGEVNLPNCTVVGSSAFLDCSSLSTLSIPKCETIGAFAFQNCTALSGISLSLCSNVGTSAFSGCLQISEINMPNCEIINDRAFMGLSAGVSLSFGSKIQSVGTGAFGNYSKFTSLYLGDCSYIGANAFYSCSKLSVDFGNLDKISYVGRSIVSTANMYVETVSNQTYYGPIWLSGQIATPIIRDGTMVVPPYVFGFTALNFGGNKVSLPSTIKCIAEWGFCSQTGITFDHYDYPNLTHIGQSAFYSACRGAHSVIAPNLNYIGNNAFAGAWVSSRLTSISFSKVLNYVGSTAFRSAYKTNFLNSAVTILSIGTSAFYQCSSMSTKVNLSFAETNQTIPIGAFCYCSFLGTVVLQSVYSISNSAFYGCNRLESLYVLKSVPYLLNAAVFGQTPLSGYSTALGKWGSIYVEESLYSSLRSATYWSTMSARMVSITEAQVQEILEVFE